MASSLSLNYCHLVTAMIDTRLVVIRQVLPFEDVLSVYGRVHLRPAVGFGRNWEPEDFLKAFFSTLPPWRDLIPVNRAYNEENLLDLLRDIQRCHERIDIFVQLTCHELGSTWAGHVVDYAMHHLNLHPVILGRRLKNTSDRHLNTRVDDAVGRLKRYGHLPWVIAMLCHASGSITGQFVDAGIVELLQEQLSVCKHGDGVSILGRLRRYGTASVENAFICSCVSHRIILRAIGHHPSPVVSTLR